MLTKETLSTEKWNWFNAKIQEESHPKNRNNINSSPLLALIRSTDGLINQAQADLLYRRISGFECRTQIAQGKSRYKEKLQNIRNQGLITESDFDFAQNFFD